MHLLLFLLLLLQASLVRARSDNPKELTYEFRGGFPAGSLITVYFLHLPQEGGGWSNKVGVNLWEDYGQRLGRLHFRLDDKRWEAAVVSNVMLKEADGWQGKYEEGPEFWFPEESYPPTTGGDWWRFDLYKINDTAFLPFFQGFRQGIRTMKGVRNSNSLSVQPTWGKADRLNLDLDEVSVDFRPLNKFSTGKPEMVLTAMDPRLSEKDMQTTFMNLDNFPDKTELKLSVMMVSYYNKEEPFRPEPKLFFYAKGKGWAFGLETIWNEAEKRPNLRLFKGSKHATKKEYEQETVDCIGTNADLVHARLERVGNTIKARIDYKDCWPDRYECEMNLSVEEAKHLDGPLTLRGYHGAALLYFATEDLYYYH